MNEQRDCNDVDSNILYEQEVGLCLFFFLIVYLFIGIRLPYFRYVDGVMLFQVKSREVCFLFVYVQV